MGLGGDRTDHLGRFSGVDSMVVSDDGGFLKWERRWKACSYGRIRSMINQYE